ncbi:AzlC family ABC transporter permease [Fonticella tunisiensis]|uniref:4-azaleucine resistance transporter AzlC n=1 Tax=Fonticella tunisiensis TaxID=1096341 RepID=A0A4R7KAV1_9CLOT|nr:AzlC family ABC transporter permease [Fonticella tunisiensis]TDT51042.1 4-azaleucine resistance transporter AzlC [Fonticella tunisiensis]
MDNNAAIKERGLPIIDKKSYLLQGVKSGIPIAIGYIPIGMAFGLLAKSLAIPNYVSILMSLTVFAGASQFMAVNLISIGTPSFEIVLAVFILNLRHFLMSASISQRIMKGLSKKWMSILSFGITDETFTVASLREDRELNPMFLFGLNSIAFAAWNLGTIAGIFVASGLPESIKSSMGIALYSMFIGLLVPSLRKSMSVCIVAVLSMLIHTLLHYLPIFSGLSSGWSIIITTIIASTAGALLYPKGVYTNE